MSCEGKTLGTGLDFVLPLKSKTIIANELPWISKQLKSLLHERQIALARGDKDCFRRLRNRVFNRLRKSCRAKCYESKVEHLRDCEPRRWGKEVKLLGGMQSATRTDPTYVLKHIDSGPDSNRTAVACTNELFYSIGSWNFGCRAIHRHANGCSVLCPKEAHRP